MKPLLVVITGPTAIGKSSLSIQIAKHYACPVVSADSRQVYKEMFIGTAVPSKEELKQTPHYFIQSHSIHDSFNAGKYEEECITLLEKLFQKNKCVVLTGGSGLYIDAVLFGKDDFPEANQALRKKLNNLFKLRGIESLQEKLKVLDPVYFEKVDKQNPQRLIRAIEVCTQTGLPYSSQRKATVKNRDFNYLLIALEEDREVLYNRINERVDKMMEDGLLEEVKSLHEHKNLNAVQTVGYSELFDFIDGKQSLEDAISKIKQHTRNYAKRQITWLKKYEALNWVRRNEEARIIQLIDAYLK